jgi:glycosyltransferase involved in cell wall biosynthesis
VRIQVNGRYLVQRVTGVQRYAREIVARFSGKVDVIQPGPAAKGLRGHLWEQAVLPWRLQRGLLWSPCATGPLAIRNQIITIHDCAFCDCPDGFTRSFASWYRCLVPRLARRALRILTVSAFSRQRICELFRVPEEKVVVTHNGVAESFRPLSPAALAQAKQRLSLPGPYVLCAGSLEPRKNLKRLLAAWQRLGSVKNGLTLLLVGATSHVFRNAGIDLPPGDVRLAGFATDEDLRALLAGAEAFVFPSLYEGFGLPVLEAMACGTPVVCSSTTSLPEVAGDAAVPVDPMDVDSIASGLMKILEDRDLRVRLRERGIARAKNFSWDDTANRTWDAFQSVL